RPMPPPRRPIMHSQPSPPLSEPRMAHEHRRLGELLVEAKLLSPEQLDRAIADQKKNGQMLGATLLRLGMLKEADLLTLLQRQLGLPLVDLETLTIDEQVIAKVKEHLARKYVALPLEI